MRGPAAAIADAATRSGAEMIVVGGTSHAAFVGALAGSTPQRLLHAAPCPVLVAPAPETGREPLPRNTLNPMSVRIHRHWP